MAEKGTSQGTIKSGDRMFSVIEALMELDGASVSELADHLNQPQSTTHRYLKTLQQSGYIDKEGVTYHLGLKFLDIGGFVRNRTDVARMIKPKIKELADESGELSAFIMEDDGLGVFVHRVVSLRGVHSDARLGKRTPLHLTSGGKAILAHIPSERLEEILAQRGLTRKTNETITDREVLQKQLDQIRERGYAFGRGENTDGLYSVGAPVRGTEGEVFGAVTVAGPAYRMEGQRMEEEIPSLLLEKINEFELNFSYS